MIFVFLMTLMAILSSLAGGTFPGSKSFEKQITLFDKLTINLTWVPELIFAVVIGAAVEYVTGSFILFVVATSVSYISMQTGHWTVLGWDQFHKDEFTTRTRPTIEPVVDLIQDKMNMDRYTDSDGLNPEYSRLFMGVKGFLIGLPVGGIITAVTWPLAYEIGNRLKRYVNFDTHIITELLAGAGVGFAVALFVTIFG